jgi:hypothetical protein
MSYSHSKITNKFLKDLLPAATEQLLDPGHKSAYNIDNIWMELVGEKMAKLTSIQSFNQGIMVVKVKGASLNHLLSTTEKPKILAKLKTNYPFLKVKNLVFRSG